MSFEIPTADRARMEQLLEYLGDTSRYSEYYEGNRAEDFKKCFDIESKWCWKYADLVLRGMKRRELEYAEGHHAVPNAFYCFNRHTKKLDVGNLSKLSYGEHLYCHYCLTMCSMGIIAEKMKYAFLRMYSYKTKVSENKIDISSLIPEIEYTRIRGMMDAVKGVGDEGRAHYYDDVIAARKDYYAVNRNKILVRTKTHYVENRDVVIEKRHSYYTENREEISIKGKQYREQNKDKIYEYQKEYRKNNGDLIKERSHSYYEENKEIICAKAKKYREKNKEAISNQRKQYRAENKKKISESKKAYRKANREILLIKENAYREAKKAAGYRYRTDPVTGKHGWVFVGLPEQEVAA